MLKSMGIFITNPCECLRFFILTTFWGSLTRHYFHLEMDATFAATSEMQLCSLFSAKPGAGLSLR